MSEKKPESKTPSEPNLVRRLDRNVIVGGKEKMLKIAMSDETKAHFLFRIGGTAAGVVKGESKFGEWIKLVGRFKAINFEGTEFISGTAFLPGDAAEMIANKLQGDTDSVSFLFDVFLRYDTTIAASYGFIIEPVRKATEGDPIDLLFNDVKAIPMLAAPK